MSKCIDRTRASEPKRLPSWIALLVVGCLVLAVLLVTCLLLSHPVLFCLPACMRMVLIALLSIAIVLLSLWVVFMLESRIRRVRTKKPCHASRVLAPLQVKRCRNGNRELLCDLRVNVTGTCHASCEIVVGEGFVTDFSSIPTPLQWVMRWSKVDVAGVVHDWLYREGRTQHLKRVCADEIWRLVALSGEHRANRVQAELGWLALRVTAWWHWGYYHR